MSSKTKVLIDKYLGDKENKSLAYMTINDDNIDILKSNTLSYLHIKYCIDNNFYDESIHWSKKAIKRYPDDKDLKELTKSFSNNSYDEKASDYNKKKRSKTDKFNDCCTCCDCWYCDCDCCIDFGKFDHGCIDIDDICFLDC